MVNLKTGQYPMADFARYQTERAKEPHSLCADPGFVEPGNLDFRLRPDSPCVDAGGPEDVERDFGGTTIPQGKAPDIGAFELAADG
jgi:hypothetical protein